MLFRQYRFLFQATSDLWLECSKIVSSTNDVTISRVYTHSQKTLDSIVPTSSGDGACVWMFDIDSNPWVARKFPFRWLDKAWQPFNLEWGSKAFAEETVVLTGVRYDQPQDLSWSDVPIYIKSHIERGVNVPRRFK